MASISSYAVSSVGLVTFRNPATDTNPILTSLWRSGKSVATGYGILAYNAVSYQLPAGFKAGDIAQIQRIAVSSHTVTVESVYTATVPAAATEPVEPSSAELPASSLLPDEQTTAD